MLNELYDYNDWANGRLLRLCEGLSGQQLDEPRELGFGSLRATLFHLLQAERLWLDRWQGRAWAPLATDPQGISLDELASAMQLVAAERNELLEREEPADFARVVTYADTRGNQYAHHLGDLLLHVANHGTHHRAQALHFLKHCGRKVVGGLDYLFYKLACPALRQDPASDDMLRAYGLEVATAAGSEVLADLPRLRRLFRYGDWAFHKVLDAAQPLDDAALDRPFDMGMGTLRRNLLHIHDAEHWWLRNWTAGPTLFEGLPESTSLPELAERWAAVSAHRDQFLAGLDSESARRVVQVQVQVAGPRLKYHVVESLLQLCGHGTHHRAQVVNQLRRSGITLGSIDYIIWVRETSPGLAGESTDEN